MSADDNLGYLIALAAQVDSRFGFTVNAHSGDSIVFCIPFGSVNGNVLHTGDNIGSLYIVFHRCRPAEEAEGEFAHIRSLP